MKSNSYTLYLILGILVASVAMVFAFQNAMEVTIKFLTWEMRLPLALLILINFSVGVFATLLLTLPGRVRRSMRISNLEKKLSQTLKEQIVPEEEPAKKDPTKDDF